MAMCMSWNPCGEEDIDSAPDSHYNVPGGVAVPNIMMTVMIYLSLTEVRPDFYY